MASDSSKTGFFLARKRLLMAALLLVGIGVVWLLSAKREPLYKGKPVSYWVDQMCRGYDSSPAYYARFEITNIGPAAVPYLIKRLRTSDRWRGIWFSIRARLPSQFQSGITNALLPGELRYGAARTLALLGPDAKLAVPELIRLLPRDDMHAIEALIAIGPEAKDALPPLRSLLTNTPSMSRRVQIAGALWQIGLETNIVLQVCTNALAPNSGDDAINAASHLMQLGPAAAPAVPFALALLQDTNRSDAARDNAAGLLGATRVFDPKVHAALVECASAGNPENVRLNCAIALWRFDRTNAPLGTRLMLEHFISIHRRNPQIPLDAIRVLKWWGLDPNDCVPILKQLLQSDSKETRELAAATLEKIDANNKLEAQR